SSCSHDSTLSQVRPPLRERSRPHPPAASSTPGPAVANPYTVPSLILDQVAPRFRVFQTPSPVPAKKRSGFAVSKAMELKARLVIRYGSEVHVSPSSTLRSTRLPSSYATRSSPERRGLKKSGE